MADNLNKNLYNPDIVEKGFHKIEELVKNLQNENKELKSQLKNKNKIIEEINNRYNCLQQDFNKSSIAVKNILDNFDKRNDDSGSDDEISVIPYTYNGTQYLLDPESKKVYNMEQEFVGKLEKKKINFDAVDSDDE